VYKRNPKGWIKHVDFIILDLLCVQLAFYISYVLRQGDWNPYAVSLYRNMAVFAELADITVIFLFETYKNVLKRGYYKEFVSSVKQAIMIVLLNSLYLIMIQEGDAYSRIVLFAMGGLYGIITYAVRILWKRYLRHRMQNGGDSSLIIITSGDIDRKSVV